MKDLQDDLLELDYLRRMKEDKIRQLFESDNCVVMGFTVKELLELKRRVDIGEIVLNARS